MKHNTTQHNTCKRIFFIAFVFTSILFSACKQYYDFDVFNHTWYSFNNDYKVTLKLIGQSDGFNEKVTTDETGIITKSPITFELTYQKQSESNSTNVSGTVHRYTYPSEVDLGLGFSEGLCLAIDTTLYPQTDENKYLYVTYSAQELILKGEFKYNSGHGQDTAMIDIILYRQD